jgi:hypothetical protein
LRLTITPILLSRDFGALRGAERPFIAAISVTAKPDQRSSWRKLNDFFALPLPALLIAGISVPTLLTAIVVWLYRRRRGLTSPAGGDSPTQPR